MKTFKQFQASRPKLSKLDKRAYVLRQHGFRMGQIPGYGWRWVLWADGEYARFVDSYEDAVNGAFEYFHAHPELF